MSTQPRTAFHHIATASAIVLIPALAFAQGGLEQQANELLRLQASTVLTLEVDRTPGISQDVTVLINGQSLTLNLVPHSVRSEHYEVRAQIADGSLVTIDPGSVRTVRGGVDGIDGSVVAGAVMPEGLTAMIDLPGGRRYWIEPLFSRVAGATEAHHVVYRDEDVMPSGGSCGAEANGPMPQDAGSGSPLQGGGCDTFPCVAELGCDADFEYFQTYGTVKAVEARINLVINTMNIQYERDVDITHAIAPCSGSIDGNRLDRTVGVW